MSISENLPEEPVRHDDHFQRPTVPQKTHKALGKKGSTKETKAPHPIPTSSSRKILENLNALHTKMQKALSKTRKRKESTASSVSSKEEIEEKPQAAQTAAKSRLKENPLETLTWEGKKLKAQLTNMKSVQEKWIPNCKKKIDKSQKLLENLIAFTDNMKGNPPQKPTKENFPRNSQGIKNLVQDYFSLPKIKKEIQAQNEEFRIKKYATLTIRLEEIPEEIKRLARKRLEIQNNIDQIKNSKNVEDRIVSLEIQELQEQEEATTEQYYRLEKEQQKVKEEQLKAWSQLLPPSEEKAKALIQTYKDRQGDLTLAQKDVGIATTPQGIALSARSYLTATLESAVNVELKLERDRLNKTLGEPESEQFLIRKYAALVLRLKDIFQEKESLKTKIEELEQKIIIESLDDNSTALIQQGTQPPDIQELNAKKIILENQLQRLTEEENGIQKKREVMKILIGEERRTQALDIVDNYETHQKEVEKLEENQKKLFKFQESRQEGLIDLKLFEEQARAFDRTEDKIAKLPTRDKPFLARKISRFRQQKKAVETILELGKLLKNEIGAYLTQATKIIRLDRETLGLPSDPSFGEEKKAA